MAPNPFKQIISEIRARRFAPVYVLSGEEAYYLDLIADTLQQFVLTEEEKDFNLHQFYGQDADIDLIINTARQYPVIAEHKLVILREAQAMQNARARLDRLESYLANPCSTTVLAIHFKGEPLRETSKLVKAAKKAKGVVYSSPKIRDYQVEGLLHDYCRENGVTLEPSASEMLLQNIGSNLQMLFGEVEKLRLALPKSDHVSITADMVAGNIGISKQYNVFELRSAVLRRDYNTCMRIVRYYAANPNAKECSPEMVSSTLFGAFANLMAAHYLPDKTATALGKELGLNFRPQQEELLTGMRNYSARSCFNIIHAIRTYDCHLKGIGSSQPRTDLLTDLVYQIFTL